MANDFSRWLHLGLNPNSLTHKSYSCPSFLPCHPLLVHKLDLFLVLFKNKVIFFLTFYFVLWYSQLKTLWWFQVNSKRTQPYMYMYPFSKLPSHPGCHIALTRVPCAIKGSCWVSTLNIAVCMGLSQTANYPSPQQTHRLKRMNLWLPV